MKHIILAIGTTAFFACNAYDLNGKIATALKPSLDASAFTNLAFSNVGITRKLSDYVAGGTAPYSFSAKFSSAVPSYVNISVDAGVLSVRRNTAVTLPTNLSGLAALPTITVDVTDSRGESASATFALNLSYRRVFVTKDIIGFDSTLWQTGGPNNYSACTSGDPVEKANCRCLVAAKARSLADAEKTRAWLSSTAIDAVCNLVNTAGKSCIPGQYAAGPWYNMIGNLIAEDIGKGTTRGLLATDTATNQPLQAAIQYYEDGTSAGTNTVWNGTDPTGIAATTANCSNWTATGGTIRYGAVNGVNTANTAPFWNGGSQSCDAVNMGFYCFQAD